MKTSLFNSILCASLLVFAVGCGKESKGGGSSNGINYNNLGAISQQAAQSLNSWYNGSVEGTYPTTAGMVNVTKTVSIYNTQPTCENKKFLGIPYQSCSFSGSPTSEVPTTSTVAIVPENKAIKDKGNAELAEAFSTSGRTLLDARAIDQYRTQLTYLNNSTGEVIVYGINRGINSKLNPEFKRVTTSSQRTDTVLSGF